MKGKGKIFHTNGKGVANKVSENKVAPARAEDEAGFVAKSDQYFSSVWKCFHLSKV